MKTLQKSTIEELKLICKENKLKYKKLFKKVDYINLINDYFKNNNIKLNEQSTETEELIPLYSQKYGFIGLFTKEQYKAKQQEIGGQFSAEPFPIDYEKSLSYI